MVTQKLFQLSHRFCCVTWPNMDSLWKRRLTKQKLKHCTAIKSVYCPAKHKVMILMQYKTWHVYNHKYIRANCNITAVIPSRKCGTMAATGWTFWRTFLRLRCWQSLNCRLEWPWWQWLQADINSHKQFPLSTVYLHVWPVVIGLVFLMH